MSGAVKDDAVFVTKILVPRRRQETVPRARLLDRLRGATSCPLTLVRAPAGYGKTTVLVDLAHDAPGLVCWISLDEWDRDLATFLRYFRLAVARQLQAFGVKLRSAAAHSEPRSLLAEMTGHLAVLDLPVWIVVDDFHFVDTAADVVALVDYLARRLPPNCRLILASRTRPPLAGLPRARVQGTLLELGPEDLAFSASEIKQYYQAVRGMAISTEEVERVSSRTQGWPAGVALLSADGADPAGDSPLALADYLAAEVTGRLSNEIARFLLSTSILDTLQAGLCDQLLEEDGSDRRLAALQHQNVPLLRVQGAVVEYRLHPLVRDHLRETLREREPERYRDLHRRAGGLRLGRGEPNEAVWHFAQAAEWAAAAEIIEREAPEMYKLGRWQLITSWLRLLHPAELRRRPRLKVWEARMLIRLGQPTEALHSISEALGPSSLELSISAEFETLRAAAFRIKGEVSAAVAAGGRAVELTVRANAPVEIMAEARKERGLAMMNAGRFAEAVADLRAALEIREMQGEAEEVAFLSGCLGSALGSIGRLADSATQLEQARQHWQRIGNAKELSWILNNLAMTYGGMGQFDLGADLFAQSLAKAREGGNQRIEAAALVSLGDVELRQRRIASAVKLYDDAMALCAQLGEMTLSTHALLGKAHARRSGGDLLGAEALANQALASADQRGSALEQGLCHIALGRIFRQGGRFNDAVAELDAAIALLGPTGASRELAIALFHLADAYLPVRPSRTSLRLTLERLAQTVRDLGYHHFLLEAAAEAPRVVEYAAARRFGGSLYRELLTAMRVPSSRTRRRRQRSAADRAFPSVEVVALGGFEVKIDGRAILDLQWESEKAKELFLLLLTNRRRFTRDEIIAALWPDAGGSRASSSLTSTLHRARRALYPECIGESGRSYFLNREGSFDYDVQRFRVLTDSDIRLNKSDRVNVLSDCVKLYRGHFAPGIDSEWAREVRMDLERRFLDAASQLADVLIGQRKLEQATEVLEAILRTDPYNETACYKLMHALSVTGDLEGAIRVYRRQRELLDIDLGERPGPSIQRLHTRIRARLARAIARIS